MRSEEERDPQPEESGEQRAMDNINNAMIRHAKEIASEIGATAVLAYVDVVRSRQNMKALLHGSRCILAARDQDVIEELASMGGPEDRVIPVPYASLTRVGQVKVAAMLALSKGWIQGGDRILALSGSPKYGIFDNLTVLDVSREFEFFSSGGLEITRHLGNPSVFERLLAIVLELAQEGKEGRPIGATFVLGDHEKVLQMSTQMVMNPFAGAPEEERNIMDPRLKETVREFASIDGAFVLRSDGVVVAAGRHLNASAEIQDLPQGLGARHRSASGITTLTDAVAMVISESTGDVRIFSHGKVFMEIEKGGPIRSPSKATLASYSEEG